ncbi:hypothetical protein NKH34_16060 [Mesorhizobium sp. M1148]|uniref:hypothetical protein n=1 Tax=unclassified Mesorhizobium TaxID=325217 RepID=UPI0003CDEF8B|nr:MULTISPECIES: hypothetical protein [unclassified Mesorhizobium]ESX34066.1 hypothetical protein X763_23895 [Mesorhizobium sp. LSHC432A00]ESY16748.1 hypothetical protein X749_31515 [Mesorhizobium sp. LNJC391B00]ESX16978.1 hypothetical protein X766_20295 [Mesorhizobium sp. LSJC255A00]ESX23418.1 hypothetical protein X765_29445 [Mesorhizobium sp. LSHC440B00]ESX29574.1 hypothetical protein X764_31655 [Mesorhizobium sp. LSHC440A00]
MIDLFTGSGGLLDRVAVPDRKIRQTHGCRVSMARLCPLRQAPLSEVHAKMTIMKDVPAYPKKTFEDGYVDGFQSLKPDVVPTVPRPYEAPLGTTPYQWGFRLGQDGARAA